MKEIIGYMQVPKARVGIIVSHFNQAITQNLLDGAKLALKQLGVLDSNIECVWVPGAFELPLTAQIMIQNNDFDAIICLGAVIRGSTPHFDYVCSQVSSGINRVSLDFNVPVIFGVLTTNTIEEAIERSGTKAGNKGADAAFAAIEMISVLQQIGKS
ncbi:6,7-dimethyl-8-ribityllumazine synthase [Candidatus Rubidus massiliensis]|nr:6,7-dimethyl-8-ribityllumazine synthase [Candidatus Rubidus massiliensis]